MLSKNNDVRLMIKHKRYFINPKFEIKKTFLQLQYDIS